MKRQKRDQTERAFSRGYISGVEGRSRTLCPHESGPSRLEWMSGWREAREDHWSGFNRAAQAQKICNM